MSQNVLLDPTNERVPAERERATRPTRLDGVTVGLLDISKPRGDVFLNHLASLLGERGVQVMRFRKPTYAKPAPAALQREIAANCQVVVEALAD